MRGMVEALVIPTAIPRNPEETGYGKDRLMSQVSSTTNSAATAGATFMLVAAVAFAGSNVLQSVLPTPVEYGGFGMASTGMVFWQYLIAGVISLPLILRIGIDKLRTSHPLAHEIRAFVSALGAHVFVYGFASGVPIWQMVTLLAAGPLFIIFGSTVFLGERASAARLIAALAGFTGAIIVSGIGSEGLGWHTLIPIAAAALWATTDVLTKYLALKGESPETLTISLLVLVTPNHLLILLVVNALGWLAPAVVPAGLAIGFLTGIVVSTGPITVPLFSAYGLVKGGFIATEAAASLAVYISKTLTFRRFDALPLDIILKGLIAGSSLFAGAFIAKRVVLRFDADTFRLMMEGLMLLAGLSMLWGAAVAG